VQRCGSWTNARRLQRDPISEEKGEEGVDLVLAGDLDQPQRRVIGQARGRARDQLAVARREEVLRVLDEDAEQRRAAQDVEALETRGGISR